MEAIVISANTRNVYGKKLDTVRSNGQLPGIVYGNKKDNQSVVVDSKEFNKAFIHAGHSTIVALKVDSDTSENVLIHDVDHDPLTNAIRHIDFFRINMNKAIRTAVPLHFLGESPAVFQQEGTLFKNIEEIQVETLPANLPSHIEVDISILDDFSKAIHVSDIIVGEGVELLDDPEQLICKVEPPRSEEEIAALDEEIGDAIPEGEAEEGAEVAEGDQGVEGAEATETEKSDASDNQEAKPDSEVKPKQ